MISVANSLGFWHCVSKNFIIFSFCYKFEQTYNLHKLANQENWTYYQEDMLMCNCTSHNQRQFYCVRLQHCICIILFHYGQVDILHSKTIKVYFHLEGQEGWYNVTLKKYIYWLQFKGLNRGPELITFLLHFVMQCLHRQEIMH